MTDGKKNVIFRQYPEQHYSLIFNKSTGCLLRLEDEGHQEPFWAEAGPELLDVSITNYCNRNCSFCYRKSSIQGKHIGLNAYSLILEQAKESNVLQIALGGGNPNMHPDFQKILRMTVDAGIVPSYTSNGDELSVDVLKNTAKYCGAMAISAYPPFDETFTQRIQNIVDFNIKLNIHFLLNRDTIKTAIQWLKCPPSFLKNVNAIIFLNYKPINSSPDLLLKDVDDLSLFFQMINSGNVDVKIGFDSCSVSGIAKYMKVNPIFYESCEAARFSAFISEDMKMYPCSFMVGTSNYGDLKKNSLKEIWMRNPSFISHRNKINKANCTDCDLLELCNGGCVFMPEINLCGN